MLNLAINGIETMLEVRDESWEPLVSSERRKGSEAGGGLVAIENAGVGFDRADAERLFASLDTKPDGLGMGCRSSRLIIESPGGAVVGRAPRRSRGDLLVCPACVRWPDPMSAEEPRRVHR
jgi:hypothetical protein